jgi:hypothetical protein
VETEAEDNSQGGIRDAGNVVRLPRDWLGPRDELVPFGPAARRAEAAARSAAAARDELELAPRPVSAEAWDCTQDDFWGGDLAAIPKPVVGPRPDKAQPAPDVIDPGSPAQPGGVCDADAARSAREPAPSPAVASYSPRAGARFVEPIHTAGRPRRHATPRLALPPTRAAAMAASVVAAALGATALVSLGGAGPRARVQQPSAAPALASAASSLILPNALDPHPRRVAQGRPRLARHPRRVTKARRTAPPAAATPTFVRVSAPSQAASTATSSGSARSSTTVVRPSVRTPAAPTTRTTTATTAVRSRTQPGPVGQGAAFGPGQLG